MSIFPYMQFQKNNPLEGAVNTGLDILKTRPERQRQQLEAEIFRRQLPFAQGTAQAEMQQAAAEAQKNQAIAAIIQSVLGEQSGIPGGMPGTMGGGAPTGTGATSAMGGTGYSSDFRDQVVRSILNWPAETPQEKKNREIETHIQKELIGKDVEKTHGTTTSISNIQDQERALQTLIPDFINFMNSDVPFQLPAGLVNPWNINKQASYEGEVAGLKDRLLRGMGLEGTEANKKIVENILHKKAGEDQHAFQKRTYKEINKLINIYENDTGKQWAGPRPVEPMSSSSAKTGMVNIRTPDGKIRLIPEGRIKAAIAAGGSRV